MEERLLDHYWIYATTNIDGEIVFTYGHYGLKVQSLFKNDTYSTLEELIMAIKNRRAVYNGVLFYLHGFMADTVYFEETIGGNLQTKVLDQLSPRYDLIVSLKWSSTLFYPNAIPMARSKGRALFEKVNGFITMLLTANTQLAISFMNHSMGNRVFIAMMESYLENKYNYSLSQIHLFAADVEDDIFLQGLKDLPPKCQKINIYYNQYDKTLIMANRLNKYPRLGIGGHSNPSLLPSNITHIDATGIQDNEGVVPQLTLHRYFYSSGTIRQYFISTMLIY